MYLQHMKPIKKVIESVCIAITERLEYLETQCKRNILHQKNENSPTEMPVDDFVISPIKQYVHTNGSKDNVLEKLTRALQDTSVYEPLEMKKYIITNRQNFHKILRHVKDKGLPMLLANHEIYHFNLLSKGCHEAVHFIWKQPREDKQSPEQLRLVEELKQGTAKYDTRQDKREIKERLKKIGFIKPHKAEFLIRDLLRGVSKDLNKCQREILQRLNTFISTGEDIIVDLMRNNGKVPKFDEFWSIVSSFIEGKTDEDDTVLQTMKGVLLLTWL